MTPTVSSLSDMTDVSTPYHHRSGASLCGSSVSRRAHSNCLSDASVDEFFAETHSIKEIEILSLYSGEWSPASTIDRYSKRTSKRSSRDSALVQEDHSSSTSQLQSFTANNFALSDTNLHYIACRLSGSMQEKRHRSETDITHLKDVHEKSKVKEKKKPKSSKYRFSLQRIVSFRKRRASKKSSRTPRTPRSLSSTAIATFTRLPSLLSSPTECGQSLYVPECLPVLDLTTEPLPAFGGKPHYYNYISGLSHSATNKMVTGPQDEYDTEEKRGDGTSVASVEWQPSVSDPNNSIILTDANKEVVRKISAYNCTSSYGSQEATGSQEKPMTPILADDFASDVECPLDLRLSRSQPCPSSPTQPWKTVSYSPSSEEIQTHSTQLRGQGHTHIDSGCSHLHQRSHSASMSTAYRMHPRLAFSDECSHITRVISPSCSINSYPISSGYGSHQSSECSLSQTDSLATQISVSEEQDNHCYHGRSLSVEGHQRVRGSSVRRHNSLSCRSRNLVNHDVSPLVRNRSNSMHK